METIDEGESRIREFDIFLKKVIVQYKILRKQLKGLIEVKSNQIENQSMLGFLMVRVTNSGNGQV